MDSLFFSGVLLFSLVSVSAYAALFYTGMHDNEIAYAVIEAEQEF